MNCTQEEKDLFIKKMNTLRDKINAEFKVSDKTLTPEALALQKFIFDTHGLTLEAVKPEDVFFFRKKSSTQLYTFKFPVKCLSAV